MLYLLTATNVIAAIGFMPSSPWIAAALAVTAIGCLITQIVIELID